MENRGEKTKYTDMLLSLVLIVFVSRKKAKSVSAWNRTRNLLCKHKQYIEFSLQMLDRNHNRQTTETCQLCETLMNACWWVSRALISGPEGV